MVVLVVLASLLLAIALSTGALPTAGLWWDALGALGFTSAAVVVFLGWESESPSSPPRLRVHRNIGIVAAVFATVHGLGYLLVDPTVIEYLVPTAPAYMLAGLSAWAFLVGMTITSLPGFRRRVYPGFNAFRRWHRGLFLFVIVSVGWHVLGTDFSISLPWQQAVAAVLMIGIPFAAYALRRRGALPSATTASTRAETADRATVAAAVWLLGAAAAAAAIRYLACAAC